MLFFLTVPVVEKNTKNSSGGTIKKCDIVRKDIMRTRTAHKLEDKRFKKKSKTDRQKMIWLFMKKKNSAKHYLDCIAMSVCGWVDGG